MIVLSTIAFFSVLWILTVSPILGEETNIEKDSRPSVTISKDQFCSGCLFTVQAYAEVSADTLANMQNNKIPAGNILNAYETAVSICENEKFSMYNSYLKYSCMKILEESQEAFLTEFEGDVSLDSVLSKRLMRDRSMNICHHRVKACRKDIFEQKNEKNKNTCSACTILAPIFMREYNAVNKSHTKNPKQNKLALNSAIEGTCHKIGYYHQPYVWLEDYCEELTEDSTDQIRDILAFREKVTKTGMKPSETLEEAMCKELHPSCYMKKKVSRKNDDL